MSAVTFDTLKFVERLKSAGVPEGQAKAISEAQNEVFSEVIEAQLATKKDVSTVNEAIAGVKLEIKELEIRMIRWVVSVGVLQTAMIAALLIKLTPS